MAFDTLQVKAVEGLLSFKMTCFPLTESTLIIDQGRLVKCDSYVTAYQQQTERYALSSREVVFV